jgi:hypothetical protein
VLSGHTLERWRERDVGVGAMTASELRIAVQRGRIVRTWPRWLKSELVDGRAVAYLLVGELLRSSSAYS